MPQPTRSDVIALIEDYTRALNAQDPDRLMALFTEATRHIEPAGGPVRSGEVLRAFFESTVNPGWSVALHEPPMVCGAHAAFALAITLDGPPPLTFLCVDTIRIEPADGAHASGQAAVGGEEADGGAARGEDAHGEGNGHGLRIAEFTAYPDLHSIPSRAKAPPTVRGVPTRRSKCTCS